MGGYYESIDGIPVISPSEMNEFFFDYLIITVIDNRISKKIINIAVEMGIDRGRIIPLRVFNIPHFDFGNYIEIKNSNISILSNSCFAGLLYHKFGMQFTSPTINMFSDDRNYLRFLKDIRGNMTRPMIEAKDVINNPYLGRYACPRGIVGDSEWILNHDKSFEAGAERWKKGANRFNYDNYIVIMAICSEWAALEFDKLPIQHKIGFFWKNLNLDSIICLPEWEDQETRSRETGIFSNLVNRIVDDECGIHSVDWMKALLHKSKFKRVVYKYEDLKGSI